MTVARLPKCGLYTLLFVYGIIPSSANAQKGTRNELLRVDYFDSRNPNGHLLLKENLKGCTWYKLPGTTLSGSTKEVLQLTPDFSYSCGSLYRTDGNDLYVMIASWDGYPPGRIIAVEAMIPKQFKDVENLRTTIVFVVLLKVDGRAIFRFCQSSFDGKRVYGHLTSVVNNRNAVKDYLTRIERVAQPEEEIEGGTSQSGAERKDGRGERGGDFE